MKHEALPFQIADVAAVQVGKTLSEQAGQFFPATQAEILQKMTVPEAGAGDGMDEPPVNGRGAGTRIA